MGAGQCLLTWDTRRSKTDTAMKNEVLAKILAHNICCVIQTQHEMDLPIFAQKSDQLPKNGHP